MPRNHGEFSLENYGLILTQALDLGYKFQTFSEYLARPQKRVVLLRHDVDVSLEYAMEMADLEDSLKISSTYFVRLHSSFYNLLDHRNLERLRQLLDRRFEIALHQEVNRFTENIDQAAAILQREKALMEILMGQTVHGVSAHLPKWHTIRGSAALLAATGFNYSPSQETFNRGAVFVSDSNRRWKEYSLQGALGRSDKVLANIHPVWWVDKGADVAALKESLKAGF
jgi:hypothetical protein